MNSINAAVFVLLAASVSAGILRKPFQDCPLICPQIYMPVCASNGNEARIFTSDCHMKMTNCKDVLGKSDVFTPREMDLCVSTNMGVKLSSEPQECPQMCPKLFDPVCASNGKEAKLFYSECHLNMANCKGVSKNVFTSLQLEECNGHNIQRPSSLFLKRYRLAQCPLTCPKIYMPICASNGRQAKLFYSECHMLQANCKQLTGARDIYTPRETELCS